jgi:probable HAF family extracellular repeat protein
LAGLTRHLPGTIGRANGAHEPRNFTFLEEAMMNCKTGLRLTIAFLLFIVLATAAEAPKLTFESKKVKFPGAAATAAYGLNNSGVIVGQYLDQSGVFHGFSLDHGKGTTIDDPKGTNTLCAGINSAGAIVGQYTAPSGDNHGFLYENGKFTDITPDKSSGASGINDEGDIVGGYAHCQFCQQHGFLWNGHKYKRLDVPGAQWTGAGSINNQRVITIIAPDNSNHYHSYLYRQGKYTEVQVPGAYETFLQQVNNSDDLALTWDDTKQNNHGALRYKGLFYKFDYSKGVSTDVFGLNDHHLIVGDYGVLSGGAFQATF